MRGGHGHIIGKQKRVTNGLIFKLNDEDKSGSMVVNYAEREEEREREIELGYLGRIMCVCEICVAACGAGLEDPEYRVNTC